MAKGLPEFILEFKSRGASAVLRSARGIVAMLLIDDTAGGKDINVYADITDVDFEHWTEANYGYMKLAFYGTPSRLIVIRQTTSGKNVVNALKTLKLMVWNYFCFPAVQAEDIATITAWVKSCRENDKKTFKAVLPNTAADHEGIINWTTGEIVSTVYGSESTLTAAQYTARIAGLLAGLPLSRSATGFILTDIVSASVPDNPEERVDAGELILVYDGTDYSIGRGVNSLTSYTKDKTEDVSYIKIVEGMDLYQDDLHETWKKSYVGKYVNDYDNKQMFVAGVHAYQKDLEGEVLDSGYANSVEIDFEAQKNYLESKGTDTTKMTKQEILMANTGTRVFLASDIRFVNAMEDLRLVANM